MWLLHLAAFLALLSTSWAILCPSGSSCATSCGNVLSTTSPDDLVCAQDAFARDPTGQLFRGCVDCQKRSPFYQGNDSDVQAMLYNVRYALSYCVWGEVPVVNPKVANSPCITSKACGPFSDAVQFKNLSTKFDAYQYCDLWPVTDTLDLQGCTECLQVEGRQYMANFIIALQAGCQQKPAGGLLFGLEGELFSTATVQITTPISTDSVNQEPLDQGSLSLGSKVGIAVGSLVGVLILLGCGIVWNGKRRRRAYLRALRSNQTAQTSQFGMTEDQMQGLQPFRGHDDTPLSQRPLRGWDDTPVSQQPPQSWDDSPEAASSGTPFPRNLSSYSSQYNSPVSAQESSLLAGFTRLHRSGTTSAGEASPYQRSPASDEKGKAKMEAYEMQEVGTSEGGGGTMSQPQRPRNEAPVLSHPGYGRPANIAAAKKSLGGHHAAREGEDS